MLDVLRQAQQKICHWAAAGGASIAGKLAIKGELASQAGIAGIQIIHEVTISLEAKMDHMLLTGPGHGVFKLHRGVMERLDQIVISNCSGL